MEETEVAVVGAGPAGSTIAYHLARRGRSVLLAEEHRRVGFPVQCAGLVSSRVIQMAGTDRMVLNVIRGATIFSPSLRRLSFSAPEPRAYVLSRSGLDRALADRAARAGVRVEPGWKFVGVTGRMGSGRPVLSFRTVDGESREVQARLVVGADGVTSPVARAFRLRRPLEVLPAYEAEVPLSGGEGDQVEVYLGHDLAPGLFGWSVPDGGGLARIGVAVRADTGRTARDYYRALVRQMARQRGRPVPGPVEVVVAGIPIGEVPRTEGDHVLLVGDAAGQVKPLSGGGIYTGMRAAEIAAEVADEALSRGEPLAGSLADYGVRWRRELGEEFRRAWFLRRLFLRLKDEDFERLLDLLDEEGLLSSIIALGDIDFPTVTARQLLRQSPALVRYFPKALGAWFRSGSPLAPVLD
jgi:digeranylgeranylglycerophospholipid reductase